MHGRLKPVNNDHFVEREYGSIIFFSSFSSSFKNNNWIFTKLKFLLLGVIGKRNKRRKFTQIRNNNFIARLADEYDGGRKNYCEKFTKS